jgi:hypothetical protein
LVDDERFLVLVLERIELELRERRRIHGADMQLADLAV